MRDALCAVRSNQQLGALLLCGVLAPLMLAFAVVVTAALTPGYSHVLHTASQLGTPDKPHPEIINGAFVLYGLMINAFAYGLYQALGRSRGARVIWSLVGISGAGILMAAFFHTDSKALSEPTSVEGLVHAGFAQLAYFSLVIAMCVFAWMVRHDSSWRGFAQFSVAMVVFSLVLSAIYRLDFVAPIEGAVQRALYGSLLLWAVAVAVRSLRLAANAAAEGRGGEDGPDEARGDSVAAFVLGHSGVRTEVDASQRSQDQRGKE
ncbi:MAG: hypothetical protein DRI39_09875 [Chloroflexi bacterium]|nr:MAG: hypothetical protein DRI39_09875 [Chloroflexota bacterium]RLC96062.1 MAG: hypothetical protein DRI40_04200 [Chloroflexota bacterium]